mmetsp:Transcript_76103/g.211578  ORF Transcript_76103/g.211578 Transcript_76103/m.211578 type:complete len:353 (-) Transcript_76103:41-1099(-)
MCSSTHSSSSHISRTLSSAIDSASMCACRSRVAAKSWLRNSICSMRVLTSSVSSSMQWQRRSSSAARASSSSDKRSKASEASSVAVQRATFSCISARRRLSHAATSELSALMRMRNSRTSSSATMCVAAMTSAVFSSMSRALDCKSAVRASNSSTRSWPSRKIAASCSSARRATSASSRSNTCALQDASTSHSSKTFRISAAAMSTCASDRALSASISRVRSCVALSSSSSASLAAATSASSTLLVDSARASKSARVRPYSEAAASAAEIRSSHALTSERSFALRPRSSSAWRCAAALSSCRIKAMRASRSVRISACSTSLLRAASSRFSLEAALNVSASLEIACPSARTAS